MVPNCGTDLVGRKELATLLQTTAQDDCLRQFPDGMNILWDTPLPFTIKFDSELYCKAVVPQIITIPLEVQLVVSSIGHY